MVNDMKKKKGCLILPIILFIFTFRIAIINEYKEEIESPSSLKSEVNMISNVRRYPLVVFVNAPQRVFVSTRVNREITNASIEQVELIFTDRAKQGYDHEKYSEVIIINDRKVNFVLNRINLPPKDVILTILVRLTTDLGESDYLILCRLTHKKRIEFGNYVFDRLKAI